jgi:hypothetical protein
MSPKTRATIDDLAKVEGKAELVNGEIVERPPSGEDPGTAGFEIAVRLRDCPKSPFWASPGSHRRVRRCPASPYGGG